MVGLGNDDCSLQVINFRDYSLETFPSLASPNFLLKPQLISPIFSRTPNAARSPEIIAAFKEPLSWVSPARKTPPVSCVSEGATSY